MSSEMKLAPDMRDKLIDLLQRYFREELDQDIGSFDAGFLLDFFMKEAGTVFYNQGLYDAQAVLNAHTERLGEEILSLEKH